MVGKKAEYAVALKTALLLILDMFLDNVDIGKNLHLVCFRVSISVSNTYIKIAQSVPATVTSIRDLYFPNKVVTT